MIRKSLIAMLAGALAAPAHAAALPSDELPAALLEACDAAAPAYGGYAAPVARGAAALVRLGVFTEREFSFVKIGFCDLAGASGPVATTSCARDTILLDFKYDDQNQDLALAATLAHEMKHQLQHKEGKARLGEAYCASAQYEADKPALEDEADRFGDAVAALLYLGRPIGIRNDCPAAVSFYLEPEEPRGGASAHAGPFTIAPMTVGAAPIKSMTAGFRFYARSEAKDGRRWVWRGAGNAHLRKLGGETISLKTSAFSNRQREDGAFELRLTCSGA